MNQLDFKGRTAVVTGGVTGIGAAMACSSVAVVSNALLLRRWKGGRPAAASAP